MDKLVKLGIYLILGGAAGIIGLRLKFTGSPLIFSMLAVIFFKAASHVDWEMPRSYSVMLQILIGIVVGARYDPEMPKLIAKIAFPVIGSTVTLVCTGLIISIILARIGLLDMSTAYLSTSPGAMTAMIPLALESQGDSAIVVVFHFFRIVFVIFTAPLVFRLLRTLLER